MRFSLVLCASHMFHISHCVRKTLYYQSLCQAPSFLHVSDPPFPTPLPLYC